MRLEANQIVCHEYKSFEDGVQFECCCHSTIDELAIEIGESAL